MSLSQSEVVLPDSVFIYNAALNAETGFGNLVDSDSGKRSRPLQGQSNIVFNMSLNLSLIHIPSPRDLSTSRMPSSA